MIDPQHDIITQCRRAHLDKSTILGTVTGHFRRRSAGYAKRKFLWATAHALEPWLDKTWQPEGMVSRMLNSLYERHLTLLSVEMLNDD